MFQVQSEIEQAVVPSVLSLKDIDYVELYVGNPQQAAHFYCTTFGFTPIAYSGLETGNRERASYIIQQGQTRLVFTTAFDAHDPITQHVARHGDSVKDVAFTVDDAAAAFTEALRLGAQPIAAPTVHQSEQSQIITATIGVYGDVVHTFVQREGTLPGYLPGYRPLSHVQPGQPTGLKQVDHLAVCVEAGMMQRWVDFYKQVFGFHELHQELVETEYSTMNSIAVADASDRIKFVVIEPLGSQKRSQIDEYLAYHGGPGVQHIAMLTDDIVATVGQLRARGLEFRSTPPAYYDLLPERIGPIDASIAALCALSILADRDEWGYLMQIFAKPVQSRPTLFCEIIQRAGARGFGSGNIKALFQSIEREQALRGMV